MSARRFLAAAMLILHLVTGALHTVYDLDVAIRPQETIVSLIDNHGHGQSEEGLSGAHHCHGCFCVSVPPLVLVFSGADPIRSMIVAPDAVHAQHGRGIDPPPPKYLT